jgi:hypothetical protein
VRVNGDEKPLLRCNYINQGVYLDAGVAEVEFRYQPAYGGLMVEMAGILVGLTALVSVIRPQS